MGFDGRRQLNGFRPKRCASGNFGAQRWTMPRTVRYAEGAGSPAERERWLMRRARTSLNLALTTSAPPGEHAGPSLGSLGLRPNVALTGRVGDDSERGPAESGRLKMRSCASCSVAKERRNETKKPNRHCPSICSNGSASMTRGDCNTWGSSADEVQPRCPLTLAMGQMWDALQTPSLARGRRRKR